MKRLLELKYGLPPFLIVLCALNGASAQHLALEPLRIVGVPYPWVLDYWCVLVFGASMLLWLATIRWWPVLGGITSVLLCGFGTTYLYLLAEAEVDARVARIPMTDWLPPAEMKRMDAIPIRIYQRHRSGGGVEVLVAPENEKQVREVIERLGILRK